MEVEAISMKKELTIMMAMLWKSRLMHLMELIN